MDYVILTGSWVMYFVLHSYLASETTKRLVPIGPRPYRLLYSAYSTVGLVGLLIFNGSIRGNYFFASDGLIRYVSLVLTTFGVMTIQLSFRHYGVKSFLGFKEEKKELKIEGILKYIRHPIYAGLVMVTLGFFLFIPNLPTLISCACIFLYLPIGIYLEEKKLLAAFGEEYKRYMDQVPGLIPRLPLSPRH